MKIRNRKSNSKSNDKREKFNTTPTVPTVPGSKGATSYSSIIDLISISPNAGNNPVTFTDQLQDYIIMFFKYLFLVVILTMNFLGLSVSLNCNANEEYTKRILSAIFAFFFGFVYLIVNYYTYKVMSQGKICKMNREKLFPFRA